MERKEKITNIYLGILLPVGAGAVAWACYWFPLERINGALGALAFVAVFFSSYLRIQIPRTKIHLTISDALIFLSFLLYGPEIAILLAALESTVTSLNFRRQGMSMKGKTILINILVAAISSAATALAVHAIFGPLVPINEAASAGTFIELLAVMAFAQFLTNSVFVAAFVAIRTENSLWRVWSEYCINALVLYFTSAVMAGLSVRAVQQTNMFLFAAIIGFFAVIYLTYKRYADDVRVTGAKAEQAERERAEQAEAHVRELQHYVAELEKSGRALTASRERFRHAAYHDALTGLPNRNQFLHELSTLLEQMRQGADKRFAVFFLDLNRFKTVNESLGHSVGDRLITDVGRRLSRLAPGGDLVARFSGDEFAILLNNMGEQSAVVQFAEEVATELASPFTLDGRQVFTSVSIGIAFGNPKYTNAEDILRDADIAMYYAKENQKSYVIFDREMHDKAVSLLELETDFRLAVERSEFELYYQPIVRLTDVKLIGFEALIRWKHRTRGVVSPVEFIPLAESTGMIIPMTVSILQSACTQMAEWNRRSPDEKGMMVSVNLSAKHFEHPGLVEQVNSVIAETKLDPTCLKLELTESALMDNAESAVAMLKKIKSAGVRVSIDDFGTGYSSLSYLHRFPIDTLKIDRSFVSMMEAGSENGEIVRTVIALARALNLSVIAEGIESIHQLHQLRILGCDYGQGFLFSRPLPVTEIEKLLKDKFHWRNILPPTELVVTPPSPDFSQMPFPN